MRLALRQRLENDEGGFTLIELMVVVLIIAILLAISIPTFLGARQRAEHRSTQSNIRNALTVERTYFTDNGTYTASSALMTAIEPSVGYLSPPAVPAPGAKEVEVALGGTNDVCITGQSRDAQFFSIVDEATGPTAGIWYTTSNLSTAVACDAAAGVVGTQTPSGGGW
jgi:type IV pilus assembly protein PilA